MRDKKHKFPKSLKRSLLRAAGGTCTICGCPLIMATAEPHHVIPVSQGGATVRENCRIVCRPCHVGLHKTTCN